jgi:probable rRNA maturation factor
MKIAFENLPSHYLAPTILRAWLEDLATAHNIILTKVSYRFVEGKAMLEYNQNYLQHNTHTDILTFDYSTPEQFSYEAIINLEMLEHNAEKFSESVDNELIRLLSHAFFHVKGLKDKTEEDKIQMRAAEAAAIKMFHVKHLKNV